jgi:hypothetical protein
MTDLAMMFQREPFFLWKFAYRSTALGSYVLSSGPNTGSGAKDTNSEQVVRRVQKNSRFVSRDSDLIQEQADTEYQHSTFV